MTNLVTLTMHVIACGRGPATIFEPVKSMIVMSVPVQLIPTGAVFPVSTVHGQPVFGFEGAQDESAEGLPSS